MGSETNCTSTMTAASQDEDLPFNLTDRDRKILSLTEEEFHPHTWEELKQIIAERKLETLQRGPYDLRRYLKWSSEIKDKYGSVPNYIMEERLQWRPLPDSTPDAGPTFECVNSTPFADPDDFQIMPNDWPYGMAPGIRHLVVWLKPRLESEPTKGDVAPKSRQQIDDFVQKTFIDRVADLPGPAEKVMWFKNWKALQSVPGMEHVHVLVRNIPDEILAEWTGGEKPVQSL